VAQTATHKAGIRRLPPGMYALAIRNRRPPIVGGPGPIRVLISRKDRIVQPRPFGQSTSRSLHRSRDRSRTVRLVTSHQSCPGGSRRRRTRRPRPRRPSTLGAHSMALGLQGQFSLLGCLIQHGNVIQDIIPNQRNREGSQVSRETTPEVMSQFTRSDWSPTRTRDFRRLRSVMKSSTDWPAVWHTVWSRRRASCESAGDLKLPIRAVRKTSHSERMPAIWRPWVNHHSEAGPVRFWLAIRTGWGADSDQSQVNLYMGEPVKHCQ
jgi:hypothetical protein